jgi:hypothetical protein
VGDMPPRCSDGEEKGVGAGEKEREREGATGVGDSMAVSVGDG